ncbi:hypothetical protein [Sphingomonas sp. IC081]|uniref:hypothetical protein n=1 Tax=Sphingomonas sp. IC081 TaxID=304378 RepID=UPI0021AECAE0|nr:hypothetical protein [Sphingomonas sp. IC081]
MAVKSEGGNGAQARPSQDERGRCEQRGLRRDVSNAAGETPGEDGGPGNIKQPGYSQFDIDQIKETM